MGSCRRWRKVLLPVLTGSVLAAAPAQAESISGWQLSANALILADWGQTRDIAIEEHGENYRETNPILGRDPTRREVNTYFAGALLLTNGVGMLLPEPWDQRWFMAITVVQTAVVAHNHSIGLRIEF